MSHFPVINPLSCNWAQASRVFRGDHGLNGQTAGGDLRARCSSYGKDKDAGGRGQQRQHLDIPPDRRPDSSRGQVDFAKTIEEPRTSTRGASTALWILSSRIHTTSLIPRRTRLPRSRLPPSDLERRLGKHRLHAGSSSRPHPTGPRRPRHQTVTGVPGLGFWHCPEADAGGQASVRVKQHRVGCLVGLPKQDTVHELDRVHPLLTRCRTSRARRHPIGPRARGPWIDSEAELWRRMHDVMIWFFSEVAVLLDFLVIGISES